MKFKIIKSKRNFSYLATYSYYHDTITLMRGCNIHNIIDIINHESIHNILSFLGLDKASFLFDFSGIEL